MYGFNYLQFRFDIIVTSYVNKMNGQILTDTQTYFFTSKDPVGSKNVHVMEKTSLACPICLWMCLGQRMSL